MNNLKYPALVAFCVTLLVLGIGLNMYFEPHRDVKTAPVFDEFDVDDFTSEFLDDPEAAQEKYLSDDGDSKIVEISGTISDIDTNLKGEIVIELRGEKKEAGARFNLMDDQKETVTKLKVGDKTKITGVVSAGAQFDKDLNIYLDAILEQSYF